MRANRWVALHTTSDLPISVLGITAIDSVALASLPKVCSKKWPMYRRNRLQEKNVDSLTHELRSCGPDIGSTAYMLQSQYLVQSFPLSEPIFDQTFLCLVKKSLLFAGGLRFCRKACQQITDTFESEIFHACLRFLGLCPVSLGCFVLGKNKQTK